MKKTLLALAVAAIGFASCSESEPKNESIASNVPEAKSGPSLREMMLDSVHQILSSHVREYAVSQELLKKPFRELVDSGIKSDKEFVESTKEFDSHNSPEKAREVRAKTLRVLAIMNEAMKRRECIDGGDSIPGLTLPQLLTLVKQRHNILQNQDLKSLADIRETPRRDIDRQAESNSAAMEYEMHKRMLFMAAMDRSPSGSYYEALGRSTYINPYGNMR